MLSSAALVSARIDPDTPTPFVAGDSAAVRVANLDLAPPGCDPRRRAAGLAEVSQGKQCDERSCRPQGSNVMVQLTAERDSALYTILVAQGRCGRPPRSGTEIAHGDGATLHKLGATTHLDILVIGWTGGDYAIVVRDAKHAAVACGVIRRDGPI